MGGASVHRLRHVLSAIHAVYLALAWIGALGAAVVHRVRRAYHPAPLPRCPEHVWVLLQSARPCGSAQLSAAANSAPAIHGACTHAGMADAPPDLLALARLCRWLISAGARVVTLCDEDNRWTQGAASDLRALLVDSTSLSGVGFAIDSDLDSTSGAAAILAAGRSVSRRTAPMTAETVTVWCDADASGEPRQPSAKCAGASASVGVGAAKRWSCSSGGAAGAGAGGYASTAADPAGLEAGAQLSPGETRVLLLSGQSGRTDVLRAVRAVVRAAAVVETMGGGPAQPLGPGGSDSGGLDRLEGHALTLAALECALSPTLRAAGAPALLLSFPPEASQPPPPQQPCRVTSDRQSRSSRSGMGLCATLRALLCSPEPLLSLRGLHPFHMALTDFHAMDSPPSQATGTQLTEALQRFAHVTQRHGA
ncbi:hypothetical protein T492DRAFT_1068190 [Pavlovales sp. CCMP2436]|nr:hypothetical protein T492DRAFT_1068190 [Pavlovales sp. CCMP2436]